MQAIRLLNFCLKLGQASKIFVLLFLRSVLLIVCVCRINGAFSELISQRRMCFIHSPRESWLCSVTIKVIYIINLSPWMPIAKFLNLYLLCCWKKCVIQALGLRTGGILLGRNIVFEILFSLFRNFKCQFQKQN